MQFEFMYHLSFRPYCRPFHASLYTAHGVWQQRQGIILRLANEQGQVGFGEIAPLDGFGTETLEQALTFCHQLFSRITAPEIAGIPANLPACQFGFEAAWEMLQATDCSPVAILPVSGLLPTGKAALQAWRSLWQQGYRTLKWKIGMADCQEELGWFATLMQDLPAEVQLRLDANGGLTEVTARLWLEACGDHPRVEFLEQPLPPDQFDAMMRLSDHYPTPVALDESVATLDQMEHCYERGWRGIMVIKAAIAGSPNRLRQFCQTHTVDLVWSSALETAIAQQFIQTHLIPTVPTTQRLVGDTSFGSARAIGFGINHWFADQWHQLNGEQLWQIL